MTDRIRQLLYYAFFAMMVCSLWTLAWSKNLEKTASQSYWPARDAALAERVHRQFIQPDTQPEEPISDVSTSNKPSLAIIE